MDFRTGGCLGSLAGRARKRERRADLLCHIVLHDPGDGRQLSRHRFNRVSLLCASEQLRCERFWWYSGPREHRDDEILSWLESTTAIGEWLKSPRSFRAPRHWPEQVEQAWGIEVPTPWEVANAIQLGCRPMDEWWYGHDVATLVSYACGLSIQEIKETVGVGERAVVSHMVSAVERMLKEPCVQLWLMNLDFGLFVPTLGMDETLIERLRLQMALAGSPLMLASRDLKRVMASPLFRRAAHGGVFPRRVGPRRIGGYVIVCESRD